MAGKVIDYLLSVADEQAALPEKKNTANIRAASNNHRIHSRVVNNLFEFQFLVLRRSQSEIAAAIS